MNIHLFRKSRAPLISIQTNFCTDARYCDLKKLIYYLKAAATILGSEMLKISTKRKTLRMLRDAKTILLSFIAKKLH